MKGNKYVLVFCDHTDEYKAKIRLHFHEKETWKCSFYNKKKDDIHKVFVTLQTVRT